MNNTDDPTSGCLANYDGNDTAAALACLAAAVQTQASQQHADLAAGLDAFFLIFAASLMFMLQAGFAMVCAGCVRQKNVQNTMMKNILDCCGAALGFFVCGYAFAYGGTNGVILPEDTLKTGSTFAGTENFFLIDLPNYAFWFYQFTFAATTATIVAGCLAERCQMMSYFFYSLVVATIVFPLNAHALWSIEGIFNAFKADPFLGVGVVDFAGAGVVHLAGGTIAFVASIILGPRRGRFYDAVGNVLEHPIRIQGYSVPIQTLGTLLLWFGWYGCNV
jgi:Amt family ammonium transporter